MKTENGPILDVLTYAYILQRNDPLVFTSLQKFLRGYRNYCIHRRERVDYFTVGFIFLNTNDANIEKMRPISDLIEYLNRICLKSIREKREILKNNQLNLF